MCLVINRGLLHCAGSIVADLDLYLQRFFFPLDQLKEYAVSVAAAEWFCLLKMG